MGQKPKLKIRQRERYRSGTPDGIAPAWTEWQVVGPRGKVLARCDCRSDAEAALKRIAAGGSNS